MPPYKSNISSGDLELGQDYFGSIVTKIEQNVSTDVNEDDVEIYVVKRTVTLKNGAIMNEKYKREKSLGKLRSKIYELKKDDDKPPPPRERRKSGGGGSSSYNRDSSQKKKKRTPKKNRSMPSGLSDKHRRSPTKSGKKKRCKSIPKGRSSRPEPCWYNFDDAEIAEPPPAPPPDVVGKLRLEEIWQEKMPEVAIVYPPNDAPDRQDEDKELIIARGTWKFSEDKPKPEGSDTWVPTYVQLDLDGTVNVCREDERVNNNDNDNDDERPQGVWGLNPSDGANAANPSDLWFYPPDEEMDDNFQPIGKWKMMKENLWPPKSIGHVVDKRQFKQYKGSLNNVGKLKMPAFFSGK